MRTRERTKRLKDNYKSFLLSLRTMRLVILVKLPRFGNAKGMSETQFVAKTKLLFFYKLEN